MLLLAPAPLAFIDIYFSIYEIIAPVIETKIGDPREVAQSLSVALVNQLLLVIAIIPAILVVSLLIIKAKYYESWYVRFLKTISWLMIFTLPFFLFIGLLMLFLSSRAKKNA
jgi:Mn2+/Fe2+ NRAMP family transporter